MPRTWTSEIALASGGVALSVAAGALGAKLAGAVDGLKLSEFIARFVAGGISGAVAKPITAPLEAIKLKLKCEALVAPSAPCRDNKYGETADGEYHMLCECCFKTCVDETCKGCHRPLCSNCCFMSEKAPMWYCRACVVRVKLMPLWRPAKEGTVLPPLRPTKVSFGPTRVSFGE